MCRRADALPAGAAILAHLAEAPTVRRAARGRPRLWTLDAQYHCPIIGTCLDVDELQRIARRCGFGARLDDAFALHVEAVSLARSRNPASEAIQRHLETKYRAVVARHARLKDDAALREAWKDALSRGDVAGPLWALCTHRASSAETLQAVYQDIHMLSHQIGAGQAADMRRLAALEHENSQLKLGLRQELAALRRQLGAAETGLAERDTALAEVAGLKKRLARFESGQAVIELGQRLMRLQTANDKLGATARRVDELERSLHEAQRALRRLAAERDAAEAGRAALEALLHADPAPAEGALCTRAGCGDTPGARCILYVGGRAALIAQYRQLAGRLGIRLIHHDGGLEESLSRLPDMIVSADAVLCPTDKVSHNAYHHVKNHCKKAGKPCLFYAGGGVSGFAVAVERVRRGEYSIAGGAITPPT